jgi:hypothetical protein
MFCLPRDSSHCNTCRFYDGGSGLWCWVSDTYPTTQILFFFVWAMVALGGSIICYTLVFLRTAGYLGGGRFAPPLERGRSTKRWACISAFGHESESQTDSGPSSGSGSGNITARATKRHTNGGGNMHKSVRGVARKLLL